MLRKPLFRRYDVVRITDDIDLEKRYRMLHIYEPFYYMNDEMAEDARKRYTIDNCFEAGYRFSGSHWGWTDDMFIQGHRMIRYILNAPEVI